MAKKDQIPQWVESEIQSAKFGKPKKLAVTGRILDVYESDKKLDCQLDKPTEDGRHIITIDIPDKIKIKDLEKEPIYKINIEVYKAPLSKKVIEYLQSQEVDMNAIYQFKAESIDKVKE